MRHIQTGNLMVLILLLVGAQIPLVIASETGGYIVQPAYDLYPEYSDLYFTPRSSETILLNEPDPSPIPFSDLPLWILVILGIGTVIPGIIYVGKHLSLNVIPFVGGFSRLTRKNILESSSREMIYRCIQKNPGVQLADLNRQTGFTYKNLLYHLNHLVKTGMIISDTCKKTARYFENSGKYSPDERIMIMHLNHQKDKKIIETVFHHPGISRHEISRLVGITGPTVSWHMRYLLNDKIIVQKKEGAIVRHQLSDTMLKVYTTLSDDCSMPT